MQSNEVAGSLLGLSNTLADAVEQVGRSVVAVHARRHVPASGIHWRQGVIVTADHILEREEGITLTLPDGQSVGATVAGRDSGTDLAVLRFEAGGLDVAEIGSSADLRVGHIVLAVARPGEVGISASWGAISAMSGPWRTWSGGHVDQFIRPDLTLYPGFSGGPLIDTAGRVVGLNTSGLSRSMGLAIPTTTVERVLEALLTRGRIARGYLGVGMQPLRIPEQLKSALNLGSDTGLIVLSVESGSPAERAGVLVGDIIVSLESKALSDTDDVQTYLGPDSVGKSLQARVIRGGAPADVTITVGERTGRGG